VLREGGRLVMIPQAHLTGDSVVVRLLEYLFRVTGQRYIPAGTNSKTDRWRPLQERLRLEGFQTDIEQVSLPGSEVTVVVAKKQ
jgi:hypothetical protein